MKLEQKNIIQAIVIGANRYISARGSAMYLTALESYEDDEQNSMGEYALQHRCEYEDWHWFEKNRPSYSSPVVVTAEGKFEMFAGNKQLSITKIISVEPYKQQSQSKPAAVAASK